LSPPANGPRRGDPTWIALADCTLHAKPGEVLEHATVVFRDGKITAILAPEVAAKEVEGDGKGDSEKKVFKPARIPIGPRVVDCKGMHVYAAFIDAYVEVDAPAPRGDQSQLHWNAKVTPERSALDGGGVDEATAGALRKAGFGAAAASPKGGVFRGRGALMSLAKAPDDASAAKPMVYVDNVYQAVAFDTAGGGYPGSQMGAVALIRQTFSDAQWQVAQRITGTFNQPLNSLDYLATAAEIGGADAFIPATRVQLPAHPAMMLFSAENELDIFRASKIAEEFHVSQMILGSGYEFRRLDCVKHATWPLILPVAFPKAPDVSTLGKQEATELREMMTWEQAPTNPRRINAMGVKFALTTARLKDRGDFLKNVRTAVKYGLPEDVALGALTVQPAAYLGASELLGTIEPGKHANVLVTDGAVFGKNNDGKESRLHAVWIEGVYHELIAPPVSFEGVWDVSLKGDVKPAKRHIDIDKDNGITVYRDDKNVKGAKVEAMPGRLSFVFNHEELDGEQGQCSMAALVSNAADGTPGTMTGFGISGTGNRYEWTAVKRPRSLAGMWPVVFDMPGHPGPVLVFDKDGKMTVRSAGAAGEREGAGELPVTNMTYDGTMLAYDVDQESIKPGGGIVHVKATVDWMTKPPVMVGAISPPDGNQSWKWKATRREENPFVGTWRVYEADGAARDMTQKDGLTIKIASDAATLTFNKTEGDPLVIKCDDVKFNFGSEPKKIERRRGNRGGDAEKPKEEKEDAAKPEGAKADADKGDSPKGQAVDEDAKDEPVGDEKPKTGPLTLTFTHDLSKLGGEGKSSDVVAIDFSTEGADKDRLVGIGTLPDGGKHEYKCQKESADDKKAKGEDDDTAPKDIPEKLALPFGPYGYDQLPEKAANLIISNATVWTCGPMGTIENGFVYIKNGKIVMVGKGEPSVAVPQGEKSTYIDVKGKHITPGIIDCHSHTGISGGVNEGGQGVTCECRVQDVTNPDAIGWYQQLAGGVTCVNNLHGSANAIGGQSQTNKLRWGCAAPDDMHFEGAMPGVKFALGENPRRANSGNGPRAGATETRYPSTRMGVEMLIRDRFIAAREYLDRRASGKGEGAPRRDLELEALGEILEGKRLLHCHAYRQDEMLMLANVAKEFKFKIGTYQHALEGYKIAEYVRDWSGGASGFADWWAYKVEVQDAIPDAFPIMHEQGVCVSFNSDSNELARHLNSEAAKAVKYSGVKEEEALKFVTLNPAKQLHIQSRVGSLEEGKDADLVIWSGHPLSNFSRCESTYVDGRCLFSIDADKVMRERVKGERTRLIQKLLNEGKKKDKKDGEAGKDDAKPSGDSTDNPGGRRRGPGGGAGGGRPPQDASDEEADAQAAALRQYFIDMYNNGSYQHQQGVCGCGVLHQQ